MSPSPTAPSLPNRNLDRKEGHAMPTYETPEPIDVHLRLGHVAANVRVVATDRTDTTVDVRPADPTSKHDLKVVEQTRIDFADGRLTVMAPKIGSIFGRSGSVDVTVALPAGSRLQGETGMGELRSEGRLGECRFKTAYGDLRLDQVATAELKTASGAVNLDRADGAVEVTTGSGSVHLGRVEGTATVKNSNGDSWIGDVTGNLAVRSANGTISVERAHADVTAKTANGGVRVGEVARGAVTLETAAGTIEVGVRAGTAAWLDVNTTAGRVRNELATTSGPESTDETVEVRARTYVGDIVVRRA
jgi:DUF4097 and DUF4098 domain-containing protein YvlB